jgi:hypothetical protein
MPARSLGESWSWIQGLQTVQEDGECAGSQVAVWVVGKRKHQQRARGGQLEIHFCRWSAQLERGGPGRVMYCALCPQSPVYRFKRDPPRRTHLRRQFHRLEDYSSFTFAFTKKNDGALPGVRWRRALRCMRTGMRAGHRPPGGGGLARPASGC